MQAILYVDVEAPACSKYKKPILKYNNPLDKYMLPLNTRFVKNKYNFYGKESIQYLSRNASVDGPGLRFYWYIPSTGQNRSKMVQYTKIDANRCVLKPFWGVLEAFWGKNGVFWGGFGVGRRGFWIEKWDERGDGRWDSGEKSWWAGGFLDSFYLCKISPMPLPPIFSIFGGFFFRFRRALPPSCLYCLSC